MLSAAASAAAACQAPAGPALGVAVEGDARAWPQAGGEAVLPRLDRWGAQSRFIEVFDRGAAPVRFTIEGAPAWVRLSEPAKVAGGSRVEVSVDWSKAPAGLSRTLSGVTSFPATALADAPGEGPRLEYRVWTGRARRGSK